jgi:hypothetical protein
MNKKRKLLPKATQNSPFYLRSTLPVPLDVWRACMIAYQAAAELKMPGVDPTEYKIGIAEKLYTFPNNPMNRGIFAVKEFLGQDQADLMPAVCARLMAVGVIREIRDDERFAQFFKGDAPDGDFLVDDALLDSFATATFVPRTLDFDLQSVLAIANDRALQER